MGIRTELIVNPPMPHCLLCTICKDLLEDPAEVSGCEHIYCRKCIEDWLVKNDTCPMDRQKTSKVSLKEPSRTIRELLGEIQLHCPEEGCDDIIQVQDLKLHLEKCKTMMLACDDCNEKLLKKHKLYHKCLPHLKGLIEKCDDGIAQCTGKIGEMNGQITVFQENAEKSNAEVRQCEKEIENLKLTFGKEIENLNLILENMKTEVSDLKENLLGKEKDIQSLKDKEEKLQLELSGLKKALGAGLGMIRDVAAIE